MAGQVGRAVPAGQDALDIELRILADRDQGPWGDEGGQLTGLELAAGVVQPDGVGGEEGMGLVAVQLGALVFVDGILDREGVQPELFGEDLQVGGVGLAQVQPDHRGFLLEVVGDLGGREHRRSAPVLWSHPIALGHRPRLGWRSRAQVEVARAGWGDLVQRRPVGRRPNQGSQVGEERPALHL
jgi:hypothetical protein